MYHRDSANLTGLQPSHTDKRTALKLNNYFIYTLHTGYFSAINHCTHYTLFRSKVT